MLWIMLPNAKLFLCNSQKKSFNDFSFVESITENVILPHCKIFDILLTKTYLYRMLLSRFKCLYLITELLNEIF